MSVFIKSSGSGVETEEVLHCLFLLFLFFPSALLSAREEKTPYEEAGRLALMFQEIKAGETVLDVKDKKRISDLVSLYQNELKAMGKDPEEYFLLLNQEPPKKSLILPAKPKEKPEIKLDFLGGGGGDRDSFLQGQFSLQQTLPSNRDLSFKMSGGNLEEKLSQRKLIRELSYAFKPQNQNKLHRVQAGRIERNLGLGGVSSRNGLLLSGLSENKQLQLGYLDGLYAQLDTPFLMDADTSFYVLFAEDEHGPLFKKDGQFYSGFQLKKELGLTNLRVQFAEFHADRLGSIENQSALQYNLDYQISPRLQFNSVLRLTGMDFRSSGQDILHLDHPLDVMFFQSLSTYFGSQINETAGYGNLGFGLSLKILPESTLSLGLQNAKNHSSTHVNSANQFSIAALGWKHKASSNTAFSLDLQRLLWDQEGRFANGSTFSGKKEDASLLQSSIQIAF